MSSCGDKARPKTLSRVPLTNATWSYDRDQECPAWERCVGIIHAKTRTSTLRNKTQRDAASLRPQARGKSTAQSPRGHRSRAGPRCPPAPDGRHSRPVPEDHENRCNRATSTRNPTFLLLDGRHMHAFPIFDRHHRAARTERRASSMALTEGASWPLSTLRSSSSERLAGAQAASIQAMAAASPPQPQSRRTKALKLRATTSRRTQSPNQARPTHEMSHETTSKRCDARSARSSADSNKKASFES